MTAFTWDDAYSVGNAAIDAQHRRMIGILNHLHRLLNHETLHDPAEEAGEVFDELAAYVVTHFAYEEELMAEAGYPEQKVVEHKRQHESLLGRVQAIMLAYQDGDTEALRELLPYLYGDWLIEHICHSDKDYAGYLQALAKT